MSQFRKIRKRLRNIWKILIEKCEEYRNQLLGKGAVNSAEMSAEKERYIEHVVRHFPQRYNWDCGVSCVLMLLAAPHREELLDNFEQICQDEGFRQSTWTIDLCYLLKRFGIRHCMYTTTLGVNEDFRRHGYYDRIINIDRERVQRRFDEASANGIVVQKHSLTHAEMLAHLCTSGPVIVLVDATLLVCDLCKHKLKAEFRRCFGGPYSGHYILVVGRSGHKLLYRDPALPPRLCVTSPARLLRARTASGTDHDVILIYTDTREKTP
ncbi:protein GUCD1 [Helicoverpa armigera]|uniref:protein GUCD1 n=1 Tax=Helicoverpa armigera TaxID=29058 RepID=UPI003083E5B2